MATRIGMKPQKKEPAPKPAPAVTPEPEPAEEQPKKVTKRGRKKTEK